MAKAKIVMLPLDERPCNFDYPRMMPKTDCELILPPKEIMGKKKTPGDVKKIADWLTDHVHEADAMILSLDTLVYGGILPSRLHTSCTVSGSKEAAIPIGIGNTVATPLRATP